MSDIENWFLLALSVNKVIFKGLETHFSEHLLELKITSLKTPAKCHLSKMHFFFFTYF